MIGSVTTTPSRGYMTCSMWPVAGCDITSAKLLLSTVVCVENVDLVCTRILAGDAIPLPLWKPLPLTKPGSNYVNDLMIVGCLTPITEILDCCAHRSNAHQRSHLAFSTHERRAQHGGLGVKILVVVPPRGDHHFAPSHGIKPPPDKQ